AIAALREQHPVADARQVGDDGLLVLVKDFGAGGVAQHLVLSAAAGALLAHGMLAALGPKLQLVADVVEGVEPVDGLRPDIAASAAIAAIRAAELDELLAPEADTAGAAAARADIDLGEIQELHVRASQTARGRAVSMCGRSASCDRQGAMRRPVTA